MMALEALDAGKLMVTPEREHWTERKDHIVMGMWSAPIAGVLSQRCSMAEIVRLLERDKDGSLFYPAPLDCHIYGVSSVVHGQLAEHTG